MNPYSAQDRLDTMMAACVAAVQGEFRWLPVHDIIDPPHSHFDAALARQIAIHLLICRFHVPKRRVVEMQARSREAVNRALRTVEERLSITPFSAAYARMAAAAHEFYSEQIIEASQVA
jgi:hypothetical protein